MSSFLSRKMLEYNGKGNRHALTIEYDYPCRACGYNCRGLNFGRKCPECGNRIQPPEKALDFLVAGPPEERRRWRLGFGLGAACCAGFLIYPIIATVATRSIQPFPFWLLSSLFILNTANWVAWMGVSWLLSPARLDRSWVWMGQLRWTIRLTPALWILSSGLAVLTGSLRGGVIPDPWSTLFSLFQGLAIVGMLILSWLVTQFLAEAGRYRCARGLSYIMAGTGLMLGLYALLGWVAPTIGHFLQVVFLVCWASLFGMLGISFFFLERYMARSLRQVRRI